MLQYTVISLLASIYILLFEDGLSYCELLFLNPCWFSGKVLLVSKSASKNNNPLLAVYVENISHRLLFDFQVLFRCLVFFKFYLFIYLWLCWVFVSLRGLSLVAASGGHSSLQCAGLSLSRPLLLRSTGSRRAGSVVVAHGLSCSAAWGILPDQGSNPCPLHWQADSQPLRHQGSPRWFLIEEKKFNWCCQSYQSFPLCFLPLVWSFNFPTQRLYKYSPILSSSTFIQF